jgi:ATP-dependent helicase/nuclease subunit A
METGVLTKYSASAGSGKTYKLTGIYLSKLFSSRASYKRILAVTFTNKAAADMKRKILGQLYSISKGESSDMASDISASAGKTLEKLAGEAGDILRNILHDYSYFNVGTIDSFFQKILKAFTREIGLQQGYLIETDHSVILRHAVEVTLENSGKDKALGEWITEYVSDRIEEGKSWNLKDDILKLAEQVFSEKFRLISPVEKEILRDREFLSAYLKELRSLRSDFEKHLSDYAAKCSELLDLYNISDDMFLRGNSGGVPSFIRLMKEGSVKFYKPLTATVTRTLETPAVFTTKAGPSPQLGEALENGFTEIFIESVNYYNSNFRSANTSAFITQNIYVLGILSDILENIHAITTSENRFLLSDAGELLWLIIKDDQTPFIYEKTGNIFENFMIDEFQDTSLIQWNNFRPLIDNSIAQGFDNLVVGDVKQSIYRWRNSDWKILGHMLQEQFGKSRLATEYLETNWRSRRNIIAFNNSLFSVLPALLDNSEKNSTGNFVLGDLYSDVMQKCPDKRDGGYVRIEFIEETESDFKETALKKVPVLIEDLQDRGYCGRDIGILVRTNSEGSEVLRYVLDYFAGACEEKRKRYNYNIISNESLLISLSPAVEFIVSLLSGIYNPEDNLSRAVMVRNWLLSTGKDPLSADLSDPDGIDKIVPEGSQNFLVSIRQMPVFEAVEQIILFFRLGEFSENTACLNAFQDCVLEFSRDNSSDISSFLEWWEEAGVKRSIVLSDKQDSMRVMTVHKSKGLEFRVVIIPFISWNLGHGRFPPTLWLKPENEPFSKLGLVPVKYRSDLQYSDFAEDYFSESYYALVDNVNMLYVAFTRAIDCLIGFAPAKASAGSLPTLLLESLRQPAPAGKDKPVADLKGNFDLVKKIYSFGEIPENRDATDIPGDTRMESGGYYVNSGLNRLRLKFHGQNWIMKMEEPQKTRLNYGRVMHEIFESINTPEDIPSAVNKKILEGLIPENERDEVADRIYRAVSRPEISSWFKPGLRILNEAEILTSGGSVKRPDRVILEGDRVIVVDFKFGAERRSYTDQVNNYKNLLMKMGYAVVDGFLWYVDNDKLIKI